LTQGGKREHGADQCQSDLEDRRPVARAVSAEPVRRRDLPFTILRRLDCILEPTKDEVLAEYKKIASTKVDPACC
jgi:hypothetical protein